MAKKEKTYSERAAGSRLMAKGARVVSAVFVVLAVAAGLLGASLVVVGEWQDAISISASTAIIAISSWSIRESAKSFDRSAETWDRLAASPF